MTHKEEAAGQRGTNPYAEGSMYYNLWESNPWTVDKMTQKGTFWDGVANFLGFRSSYDTAIDQRAQAAAEYDAQVAQMKQENEYNSPEAQAARLRAAGINPDLQGSGIDAGQAAEFAQEATPPEITPDENLTRIGAIFNGVAQAITLATGMNTSILQQIGLATDISGKRLEIARNMKNIINQVFDEFVPDATVFSGEEGGYEKNQRGIRKALMDMGKNFAVTHGLNSQQTRALMHGLLQKYDSDKETLYNKWTNNEKARKNWATEAGNELYTGRVEDADFDQIIGIMKPISEMYERYLKADAESSATGAENEATYNRTFDAEQAAQAANEGNSRMIQQKKLEEDENKARAKIMGDLTKAAEEGNKLAFFMTLVLPIVWQRAQAATMTTGESVNAKGETTTKRAFSF